MVQGASICLLINTQFESIMTYARGTHSRKQNYTTLNSTVPWEASGLGLGSAGETDMAVGMSRKT